MTQLDLIDGTNDHSPPPRRTCSNCAPNHRSKNVILFGETGAGKSAVINLLAGAEVAPTSSNAKMCTLESTRHRLTLPCESSEIGMPVYIFDTIGLEEPDQGGLSHLFDAIENAHQLVKTLHASGGIDLLLFCVRAGRITVAMQRQYRLFFEILCQARVPLAIVVTHLEHEDVMEDWWTRNKDVFAAYGIGSVAHACVTAAPARLGAFAPKRTMSQAVLADMLRKTLDNVRTAYVREDVGTWFMNLVEMLVAFLTLGHVSLKRTALVKKLEARCSFPREEAERLAEMMQRR